MQKENGSQKMFGLCQLDNITNFSYSNVAYDRSRNFDTFT